MTSTPVLPQRKPIDTGDLTGGTVYTETVIFSPPEAYVNDAPYQIAIIDLDNGGRLTARIDGDSVVIGDRVEYLDHRQGTPYFRKVSL